MCQSCDWANRVEQVGEILEKLDDLPDRAIDFREGVEEKLRGMLTWMEKNQHVTPKMVTAIENMAAGVDKWLNRD